MPSVPERVAARPGAIRPAPRRTAETFESVESFRTILAAGTTFATVSQFSGRPDSIFVAAIGGPVDVRFRYRGEAAPGFAQIPANQNIEFKVGAEIVEARDPGGGGGQALLVTGRYLSRDIDVRETREGPTRSDSFFPKTEWATQVSTEE